VINGKTNHISDSKIDYGLKPYFGFFDGVDSE